MVAWLFWNDAESRPRALWRILLHLALFALALIAFGMLGWVVPPTPLLEWLANTGILVVLIVTIGAACWWFDRRALRDLGLWTTRAWWADLGAGLVLGSGLTAAIVGVMLAAGWLELRPEPVRSSTIGPLPIALALMLTNFVLVGLGEELLFRGYWLRNLAEGLCGRRVGPRPALLLATLLVSALFAAAHANHPHTSWRSVLNTFLAGTLLALPLLCTGRLALSIGFHIAWNVLLGTVFGLTVSGNGKQVSLMTATPIGPPLWTGGAYGPEGGLLVTGALLIGFLLVVLWLRLRYGPLALRESLTRAPLDQPPPVSP